MIVWLMLLSLPFQGLASAQMVVCASSSGAQIAQPSAALEHSHHAPLVASQDQRVHHDHHAATADATGSDPHDGSLTDHHAGGKCSSCAACCVGAAMAPSTSSNLPVQALDSEFIPFDFGHYPAVDLALPERPPLFSFA